jgi:hypothetical protein
MPLLLSEQSFANELLTTVMQQGEAVDIADISSFAYWNGLSQVTQPYVDAIREPGVALSSRKQTDAIVAMMERPSSSASGNVSRITESSKSARTLTLGASTIEALPETARSLPAMSGRNPQFVVYTPGRGFRSTRDVDNSELIEKGNVDVTIEVHTLRPAAEDSTILEGAVGGSLKLDVGQQPPNQLPSLETALAWSSIGVFSATEAGKKLPKLDPLKFDASVGTLFGNAQKVPLVNGQGLWRWAFYVQKKESNWLKALKFIGSLARIGGPATVPLFAALGLPAIAWTALEKVDGLYAYLHAKEVQSDWLFQGLQTPITATKEANGNGLGKIPLLKGINKYLVVPEAHAGRLSQVMGQLEVSSNGYLVPQGTKTLEAPDASRQTATNVTYISMTIDVQPKIQTA